MNLDLDIRGKFLLWLQLRHETGLVWPNLHAGHRTGLPGESSGLSESASQV